LSASRRRGLDTHAMIAAMGRFAIVAALGLSACADAAAVPRDGGSVDANSDA
jgi:hypothetical protein